MNEPQASPSPPLSSPSPEMVQSMSSPERVAEIMRLRQKTLTGSQLSDDECRYGVRLIRAERVMRAGSRSGSTEKKAEAQKAFDDSAF